MLFCTLLSTIFVINIQIVYPSNGKLKWIKHEFDKNDKRPEASSSCVLTYYDKKLYLFLGKSSYGDTIKSNKIWKYNIKQNKWSNIDNKNNLKENNSILYSISTSKVIIYKDYMFIFSWVII